MENVITNQDILAANPAQQTAASQASNEVAAVQAADRITQASPTATAAPAIEQTPPTASAAETAAQAAKQARSALDKEALMALARERIATRRKLFFKGLDVLLLAVVLMILAGADSIAGRMIVGLCYGIFIATRYIFEVLHFRGAYKKKNAKKLDEEYNRLLNALEN